MNSHIVVGVGNIYANEALFIAGIHPERASNTLTLTECESIANAIKEILSEAIDQGGTTLRDFVNESGNPGYFYQQLRVYDRANEPCKTCSQLINVITVGQRSTYFCARCQQ